MNYYINKLARIIYRTGTFVLPICGGLIVHFYGFAEAAICLAGVLFGTLFITGAVIEATGPIDFSVSRDKS